MAEIFLSETIQVLIEKLLSPDIINYLHHEGVHTAMKKWEEMLTTIWEVLDDAEEKQITNRAVKSWLDKLQDLAYDVEDILDEFTTEALQRKLKAESQASTSRIQRLIPTSCTGLKPSTVMFNVRMGSKIKEITARLEEISTQKKHDLELREISGRMSNRIREKSVNPNSPSVSEYHDTFGRERDTEKIIELLLSGEASNGEVRVMSIIGMGGIGKTALAQDVYNDDKVKGKFDLKAWVRVSDIEEFNVTQVTSTVLELFSTGTSNVNDLDKLQMTLKNKLSKKKFLLVLDDVWLENSADWRSLDSPLKAGAPGSKIIVTTHNQCVSDTIGATPYLLNKLSDKDCLYIFAQHALGTGDFHAHPNLKQTGEEIVKRCNGLPLAAKALGCLLCKKVNPKEWKDVLEAQIWDFPEGGIIPALRLSYHHLPPDLKQCFAYCSIFPKDYEFNEEELALLWMATGLVQPQDETSQMEIGHGYFRDLLSRSFFQRSTKESCFVMHELINDLAQWVAGETCFRLEGKKQYKVSKKARHSSYIDSGYDRDKRFEAFYEAKYVRTFLPLGTQAGIYSTKNVPLDFFLKLRCLRVLSLKGYCITELPD